MDIIDLIWFDHQDKAISELRDAHKTTAGRTSERIKELQVENYQLRIRVSLLIRLLIERGVFSADDYSKLLRETQERLAPPKVPRRKK